jgi:small GTP-binding protein
MSLAVDLKVVALGSSSVGKTSIIHRYCNGAFLPRLVSTIGAGFFTHTLIVNGTEVTLLLWDTAGEERFRSVAPSLLRGANGLILVYDLGNAASVDDLEIYLEMFLDTVKVDMSLELPVVLLGNKSDIGHFEVDRQQVDAWRKKNNIVHHVIVSAKTGEGIDHAITALVRTMLDPQQTTHRPTLQLTPVPAASRKQCC